MTGIHFRSKTDHLTLWWSMVCWGMLMICRMCFLKSVGCSCPEACVLQLWWQSRGRRIYLAHCFWVIGTGTWWKKAGAYKFVVIWWVASCICTCRVYARDSGWESLGACNSVVRYPALCIVAELDKLCVDKKMGIVASTYEVVSVCLDRISYGRWCFLWWGRRVVLDIEAVGYLVFFASTIYWAHRSSE